LASDTSTTGGGQLLGEISSFAVDITSSYAWQLSYDSIVAAPATSYLVSYFSRVHTQTTDADYNGGYDSFERSYDTPSGDTTYTYHDVLETRYGNGGSTSAIHTPSTFTSRILQPGEYRLNFAYIKPRTSTETGIDRAFVTAMDVKLWDPFMTGSYTVDTTKRVGHNAEPEYRKKFVQFNMPPNDFAPSTTERDLIKERYKAKAFGLSPVIRGWKHGLYSALPVNTKTIYRRGRFGQLRDMLEQRIYTKSIGDDNTRIGDPFGNISRYRSTTERSSDELKGILDGPVTVKFVRRMYSIGAEDFDKNIGTIFSKVVPAEETTSHNLDHEATSSFPYFDLVARMRSEDDYSSQLGQLQLTISSDNQGNYTIV
jgi:hypothetical protein